MSRAAFLDRDGLINRKPPEGEYVTCWEEMQLLPGVSHAIGLLNRAGFRVIVVTNQRCVAKGLVSTAVLEAMHQRMCEELAEKGAHIEEIYYCPHEFNPACSCRKPAPGMLLSAARKYDIDLATSWMIGDSGIDVEAGRNAGCKTARLLTHDENATPDCDVVAFSLLDAVDKLLKWDQLPRVQRSNNAFCTNITG
jgi:D-glycero-D-manno-heptose 1,7-bisphosphate phosphatase